MIADTLGELYVELVLKGQEQTKKGLDDVKQGLEKTDKQAKVTNQQFQHANKWLGQFKEVMRGAEARNKEFTKGLTSINSQVMALRGGMSLDLQKRVAEVFKAGGRPAQELKNRLAEIETAFKKGMISPVEKKQLTINAINEVGASTQKAAGKFAMMRLAVIGAFGAASAAIMGFVRSGLAGTAVGNQISLQMQMLSREIASLFLPILQKIIDVLKTITGWFKRLSSEQQNMIGKVLLVGGALLFVAKVLPLVIANIKGLAAAFAALFTTNPLGLILTVVAGLVALVASTKEGREVFKDMFAAMLPIAQAVADLFGQLAEQIRPVIKQLTSALMPVFVAIVNIVRDLVPIIVKVIRALSPILNVVVRLVGVFARVLAPILRIVAQLVESVFRAFEPILDIVVKIIEEIVRSLVPVLEQILPVIQRLVPVFERIASIVSDVADRVKETLDNLKEIDFLNSGSGGTGESNWMSTATDWINKLNPLNPLGPINWATDQLLGTGDNGGGAGQAIASALGRPHPGSNHNTLALANPGFENVSESWKRFQVSASKTDTSITQQQLDTQQSILQFLQQSQLAQLFQQFMTYASTTPPAIVGGGGP